MDVMVLEVMILGGCGLGRFDMSPRFLGLRVNMHAIVSLESVISPASSDCAKQKAHRSEFGPGAGTMDMNFASLMLIPLPPESDFRVPFSRFRRVIGAWFRTNNLMRNPGTSPRPPVPSPPRARRGHKPVTGPTCTPYERLVTSRSQTRLSLGKIPMCRR